MEKQFEILAAGLEKIAQDIRESLVVTPPPTTEPETPPVVEEPETPVPLPETPVPVPTTPVIDAQFWNEKIFAPSSFWYQKIPVDAPVHSNNAELIKQIPSQIARFYGNINVNTHEYTCPIYIADANTPRYDVKQWNGGEKNWYPLAALTEQWKQVPIPDYALPSKGTDMEMAIYDPLTDSYYEFWLMRKSADGSGWEARWGGKLSNASKSDGIFPGTYGTTATSLPFAGGQITAEELRRGEIKHAIGFTLVEVEHFDKFCWPAHRSDGWNPEKKPNWIKEGQRFRLDPSVNVAALNLPRVGKIIAKAMQDYGCVVWDKAGAVSLRAMNVYAYTLPPNGITSNPYTELFEGKYGYQLLTAMPWSKLLFLPEGYGKP